MKCPAPNPAESNGSGAKLNRLTQPPVVHAAEAADTPAARVSLTALLTGSIVQDGEIVQMVIKPSKWFIILNSLLFSGVVVAGLVALHLSHWKPVDARSSVHLAILLVAARLMWSALQWMGRYYLITNLRLIRLSGVFDFQTPAIPLRKVSAVRLYRTMSERLTGKGSIEITSGDHPMMLWQTVSTPKRVCDQVHAAVNKAQSNGHCG